MIKDCPNFKTMRRVRLVASEDESKVIIISSLGAIYVDTRFTQLLPYMFDMGDV